MPDVEPEPIDLESDPRFPSGDWTGFFLQYWIPGRHKTDSQLTFTKGQLTGAGSDWVGRYTINGTYDASTGECQWIKQYLGKHYVSYRGMNEGRGIWGVWELPQLMGLFVDGGGFHIWPQGAELGSESDEAEQALLAVMRKEFGSKALRAIRMVAICACIAAAIFAVAQIVSRLW